MTEREKCGKGCRPVHSIPFKSPQNSRFTLGLLEAGRMWLFIATLRQLRVLQETPWARLVLLDLEKSIPKEERLGFGKCEI